MILKIVLYWYRIRYRIWAFRKFISVLVMFEYRYQNRDYTYILKYRFTTRTFTQYKSCKIFKSCDLLPNNVPNLLKSGEIAQHNQQHERLNSSSATVPFKSQAFIKFADFLTSLRASEKLNYSAIKLLVFYSPLPISGCIIRTL